MAQLCILAGDARSGLEQLRLAVDQGFFNPPYFQSDPVLKPVRSHPRFQEIFTKAKARHEAFGKRFQLID